MPQVRRRSTVQAIDPFLVLWGSGDGVGLHEVYPGAPHFRTLGEAKRAWESCRRRLWAAAWVGTVPLSATAFDGLALTGRAAADAAWQELTPFDVAGVLGAFDADGAAVARFQREQPKAAATISDFLQMLEQYLAHLRGWAESIPPGVSARSFTHPFHFEAGRYASASVDADGKLLIVTRGVGGEGDADGAE